MTCVGIVCIGNSFCHHSSSSGAKWVLETVLPATRLQCTGPPGRKFIVLYYNITKLLLCCYCVIVLLYYVYIVILYCKLIIWHEHGPVLT